MFQFSINYKNFKAIPGIANIEGTKYNECYKIYKD